MKRERARATRWRSLGVGRSPRRLPWCSSPSMIASAGGDCSRNPVRRAWSMFVGHPGRVRRHRAAADPRPACPPAQAAQAAARPERRRFRLARPRFPARPACAGRRSSSPRSPPSTSSSCSWPATARLHWMESPMFLRTGLPHAHGAAVHGLGATPRTRASRAPRATSAKARPGSSTRSSLASCCFVSSPAIRADIRFRLAPRCLPAPRPKPAPAAIGREGQPPDILRVMREYADDETNTESATILQMHLGGRSSSTRLIHWHAGSSRPHRIRGDRRRAPR